MSFLEIVLIGIGLSMDAFAISLCKGMNFKKISIKSFFIVALYFGTFQAIMPGIGYLIGKNFLFFIQKIDHWISFLLLSYLGFSLIKSPPKTTDARISINTMLLAAIATSIDALTIGITFSF